MLKFRQNWMKFVTIPDSVTIGSWAVLKIISDKEDPHFYSKK